MALRKLIIFLCISVCISGCDLSVSIPLDLPDQDPKIVINGFFEQDAAWVIEVTSSKGMLDNKDIFDPLKNADVVIYENDQFLQILEYDENTGTYFASENTPQPANEYTIKVDATGFVQATAANHLPVPVTVTDFQFNRNSRVNSYGDSLSEILISFIDPADIKNFYAIGLYANFRNSGEDWVYPVCFYSTDAVLKEGYDHSAFDDTDGSVYICGNSLPFTDKMINGKHVTLTFFVESYSLFEVEHITVDLKSLTEENYFYKISSNKHRESRNNPFAEPVIVFNNVRNGFGIFGGQSRFSVEVPLQ